MMKNQSTKERSIRVVVGIILLAAGYMYLGGALQIIFYAIGIIAILSAASGYCPVKRMISGSEEGAAKSAGQPQAAEGQVAQPAQGGEARENSQEQQNIQ